MTGERRERAVRVRDNSATLPGIGERIPGGRPGATKRNVLLVLLYGVLVTIGIALVPFVI